MDSSEKDLNPIVMTIIFPQKECWPSWGLNQLPPVLKSCALQTDLGGRATETSFEVDISYVGKGGTLVLCVKV